MKAKIYQPTKNAMQSGKANTRFWLLEYNAADTRYTDSVMGWNGNSDTQQQLRLKFSSREDAENYAQSKGLDYRVVLPQKRNLHLQSYAGNFN